MLSTSLPFPLMENMILTEICKQCAVCCKNYPFVNLSRNEIDSLEDQTGLQSDLFTNRKGEGADEYFLQFKENGDCIFLDENHGRFSCSVYGARPEVCEIYPSETTQKDFCVASSKKCLSNIPARPQQVLLLPLIPTSLHQR